MKRSLTRPLTRSLVRSLVRGPSLDPDAAAYIALVEDGGATVTSVQSSAIDTFIRAEKIALRWDLIKRMYLPIWGLAAPNAICMKSLTSGTFVGGVTHGEGFVQGDGSTGYFNLGISPQSAGQTLSSSMLFCLNKTAPGGTGIAEAIGSGTDTNSLSGLQSSNADSIRFRAFQTGAGQVEASFPRANHTGIFVGSRFEGSRFIGRRTSSGWTTMVTASGGDSGTLPATDYWAMASPFSGGLAFSSAEIGSFGIATGISVAGSTDCSANLKTLWETCTPHTLP